MLHMVFDLHNHLYAMYRKLPSEGHVEQQYIFSNSYIGITLIMRKQ